MKQTANNVTQNALKTSGATPIPSSVARGSNKINDGTASASVTAIDTDRGRSRAANRKVAETRGGMVGTRRRNCQLLAVSAERRQYVNQKKDNETAIPRRVNIRMGL